MKNLVKSLVIITSVFFFISCEKDEGKLPELSFKTGGNYISSDVTLTGGSSILIGIDASKSEKKDVLKKFNISKSINGGTSTSIYEKDLSKSEEDSYSYDLNAVLDTVSGQVSKYTFTITNRDGLTNQVSVSITVQ